MKKLLVILFLFFSIKGLAQFPVNATNGTPTTTVLTRGVAAADTAFWFRTSYADTTAANLGRIDEIPGAMIRTVNRFWFRNNAATAWIEIASTIGTTPNLQQVTDVDSVTTNGITARNYVLSGNGYNFFGTLDTTYPVNFRVGDLYAGGFNYQFIYGNTAAPGFETAPTGYINIGIGAGELNSNKQFLYNLLI